MELPGSAVVLTSTAVDLTVSVGTGLTTAVAAVVMGARPGGGSDLQTQQHRSSIALHTTVCA